MSSTPTISKPPKIHSCILCRQRRVRCDRKQPCSNCVKAGADCRANTPAPPNRSKKGRLGEPLSTAMKGHEQGFAGESVESDVFIGGTNGAGSESASEMGGERLGTSLSTLHGKFIVEDGKPRYVDSDLWTELGDELQEPQEIRESSGFTRKRASPVVSDSGVSDGSALLLQHGSSDAALSTSHPPPLQIFRLWQSYLDNVHPLSKLLHAPTMQHQVLEASTDPASIPKNIEALLFAIYTSAVVSLSNAECESIMGEPKAVLSARYASATEQAMVRADFLRSADFTILQAFVLLLLVMRRKYHRNTLFILTGVAGRIGQAIGVHRDGTALGLAIFETEMRRRLWWQILQLDGQSTNRCGLDISTWSKSFDSQIPSNLNDSDLYLGMTTMPAEHIGATEMIFCLVRATFGQFFKDTGFRAAFGGKLGISTKTVAEKDRSINELEAHVENRFLRFCDPSIPLHILVNGVARSAICALRLMAHHPRQYPDKGASMPQAEKDMLFAVSLNMIELGSMGRLTENLRHFLWHMFVQFQLDVFVYMLSELRNRTSGELVERAWHEVKLAYEFYPEFLDDQSNALYVAIRNLTLKAWQSRETELVRTLGRRPRVPAFVETLRSRRSGGKSLSTATTVFGSEMAPQTPEEPIISSFVEDQVPAYITSANIMDGKAFDVDFPYDTSLAYADPMDWDYWMDLIQDNGLQTMVE
ncbi:hypothetical protein MMC17_003454 [Xylographa soralifera]|nr:hypothetical protein [Xylographa soralifera]